MTLRLGDREPDAVVVDEEAVRAFADRTEVAFDDVPDRGHVHAGADDREDLVAVLHRRREEEGGLVRDHRVARVTDVRRSLERRREVLAELHAGALVGEDRGRRDIAVGVDDRDRFVFRRAGGRGGESHARGRLRSGVFQVLAEANDVRQLADEHDVTESALEIRIDGAGGRGGALQDVRDAERGQVLTCRLDRDHAHERDGHDADAEQSPEHLLPETDA